MIAKVALFSLLGASHLLALDLISGIGCPMPVLTTNSGTYYRYDYGGLPDTISIVRDKIEPLEISVSISQCYEKACRFSLRYNGVLLDTVPSSARAGFSCHGRPGMYKVSFLWDSARLLFAYIHLIVKDTTTTVEEEATQTVEPSPELAALVMIQRDGSADTGFLFPGDTILSVQLLSSDGKTVSSVPVLKNLAILRANDNPPGIYTLQVSTLTSGPKLKKIVLR